MSKEYIISACSGMKIDVKQGQRHHSESILKAVK